MHLILAQFQFKHHNYIFNFMKQMEFHLALIYMLLKSSLKQRLSFYNAWRWGLLNKRLHMTCNYFGNVIVIQHIVSHTRSREYSTTHVQLVLARMSGQKSLKGGVGSILFPSIHSISCRTNTYKQNGCYATLINIFKARNILAYANATSRLRSTVDANCKETL